MEHGEEVTVKRLEQLYAAQATRRIGEHQEQTGIWKHPIPQAVVDAQGIRGDIQFDRRVHGGVDKALHQYAVSSYARLQQAFPALAAQIVVGSMGENLTVAGMDEANVHIGDVYRIGTVTLQVSQPRNPCWKINSKFDDERLAKFIAGEFIHGWYYRVLEAGVMQVGDAMELIERPNAISVRQFLQVYAEHRPPLDALEALAACVGLNAGWRGKLEQRLGFLRGLAGE